MESTQTSEEAIYSTQSVTETQNPQGSTSSPNNSNEASDFQATASEDVLNEEVQSLTVTETGEPLTGVERATSDGMSPYVWGGLVILGVVLVAMVIKKLIQDGSYSDTVESESESTPMLTKATKKSAVKTTAKKATKKKPVAKKRKKTSKRR